MTAPPAWRVLGFSPTAFGAELFSLCREVPALDHLLCRLDELHFPILTEDRVVRNHHRDLARRGWFAIRLPDTEIVLRSGASVMLGDKATVFGVQGRRDLLLAGSRVGFGQPLTAVLLPYHRTVVTVQGPEWNIDATTAAQAMALFAAAGVDWSATPAAGALTPVLVVGDPNYAHHLWNQLGALEAVLARCPTVTVIATHQPLGAVRDLFFDYPGLTVAALPASSLPRIDPRRFLPFAPGGKLVVPSVRDRVVRFAAQVATPEPRRFLADAATQSLRLIWLTLRVHDRTAVNLVDALAGLGASLLRQGRFGIVIDGFARPHDFATNPDYDNLRVKGRIAREQAVAHALCEMLRRRVGEAAMARVFVAVGGDLLDSVHLAAHCRAYFAHHGTLQHRIGHCTKVPGLIHANPGILATDRAATHTHVIADPGVGEYVAATLVDDVPGRDGRPGAHTNSYRFNDIPALVNTFRDFLTRHGVV